MTDDLKEKTEWILRLITPIAAVTAAIGMLYLKSEFLTRGEFEDHRREQAALLSKQSETLTAIERTLAVMTESYKRHDRQELTIDDIEKRVRHLEISK